MAKNLFVVGKSGNPAGKKAGTRYSATTVKGRIERFLARNMSSKALQTMFNKLSDRDQAQTLVALLPYVLPRQSMEAISTDQIDELYEKLTEALNSRQQSNLESMSTKDLNSLEQALNKRVGNAKVG